MRVFFSSLLFVMVSLSAMETISLKRGHGKNLQELRKTCDLHISFGSYGSGTPIRIIKEIDAYLRKNEKDFKLKTMWRWGLEGEFDYCLVVKNKETTNKHFQNFKKIIPLHSKKGYTQLTDKTGRKHNTTWPKS